MIVLWRLKFKYRFLQKSVLHVTCISCSDGVKNTMDIERLQRKRHLNVQEQNALTEYRIFLEASYWRRNGLPKALLKVFKDKGIVLKRVENKGFCVFC